MESCFPRTSTITTTTKIVSATATTGIVFLCLIPAILALALFIWAYGRRQRARRVRFAMLVGGPSEDAMLLPEDRIVGSGYTDLTEEEGRRARQQERLRDGYCSDYEDEAL
jgi:hypothetical protein